MVVTSQNAEIFAGNAATLRFTITDQDTVGSPAKDLAGLSVRWALSKFSATTGSPSKTPLLEFDTSMPTKVLVTDAMNGVVEVYLAHDDTVDLLGDYYHELEIFVPNTFSLVVATGTLTIDLNIGAT